jgi:hypothetical protein
MPTVDSISPSTVVDHGGDVVVATGTFDTVNPVTVEIKIGANPDVWVECYTPEPIPTSTTIFSFVMPPLARGGPYGFRFTQDAVEAILDEALNVTNRQWVNTIHSMRRNVLGALSAGPKRLEDTDPLATTAEEVTPPSLIVFDFVLANQTQDASYVVGADSYSRVGSTDEWVALAAVDAATGDAAWMAGIGFSGVASTDVSAAHVSVDPVGGAIYVAFTVQTNLTGTTPVTATLYDANGIASAITGQTVNNQAGLTAGHYESFLAKYDRKGTPLSIKRLGNLTTTPQNIGNHLIVRGIDAASDASYIGITFTGTNYGPGGASTYSMTFGPGDPKEEAYVERQDCLTIYAVILAKTNLALEALEVIDSNYAGASNVQIVTQSGGRFMGDGRIALQGYTSTFTASAAVARANATPVSIPNPAIANRAFFPAYSVPSFALEFVHAAAFNQASSTTFYARPLSGGSTFFGGTLAVSGTGNATFSDAGGTETLAVIQDDQCFLVLYDASGNITWKKRIDKNTGTGVFPAIQAFVDDPTNNRIYVFGYLSTTGCSSMTWGPGEAGAITHNFVVSGRHSWVSCHNRTNGDVIWAHPIKQKVGSTLTWMLPVTDMIREGNELKILVEVEDDWEFDGLTTPQSVDFGTLGIAEIVIDTNGDLVSAAKVYDLTTGTFRRGSWTSIGE